MAKTSFVMLSPMRAVVMHEHGGPEVLAVEEVERPIPGPGEVLIEMRAAGLNPVDGQVRAGAWVTEEMGEPPMILGWDVAGLVVEAGEGARSFAPGDRVYGMPSFPELARCDAEYVIAAEARIAQVPNALTDEQAGALPLAGLTAWQALVERAHVQDGDRVLIQAAAGGVGHLAVQLAKARGAHVIGTARAEKHEFLRAIGVEEPVDYTEGPLDQLVSDLDVVIETVSEDDVGLLSSLAALRRGGRLVVIAADVTERLQAEAEREGKIATEMLVAPDRAGLKALASLADVGRLSVHVEAAFPLSQAADGHRRQQSGRVTGKLVLVP
jgi:NADPH:quinone reductase-like Zn-dependent oxidoreductase